MTRALLAVLILVVLTACVGRPAQDATGVEIYLQLCANCHSDDLSGGLGPALGPGSNAAEQPDEFLVATIIQGRGRMPSFATTLSDEQVDRLLSHLREAQG